MFDLLDSFNFCGGDVQEPITPQKSFPAAAAETDPEKEAFDYSTEPVKSFTPTVDPMNVNNYLVAQLTRPMGILFEENLDYQHTIGGAIAAYGGAVVAEISEGFSAAGDGSIRRGDQLVGIGKKRVSGMDFDEVMKVIERSDGKITLTVFRGPAESLYGHWASVDWLNAFVAERREEAALYEDQVDSETEAFPADNAGAAARKDLLDVVSHVVTALDEDSVGETVKADMFYDIAAAVLDAAGEKGKTVETLVTDLESHVMEPFAAEVVENEVDADVVVGVPSKQCLEKGGDAAKEVMVIDEEVESLDSLGSLYENTASQAISTALADVAREEINSGKSILEGDSLPVWKEPMKPEAGPGSVDITESFDEKKGVVGTDGAAAAVVADEAVANGGAAGEGTQESDDPVLNVAVNNANEDIWMEPTATVNKDLEEPEASPVPALADIAESFDEEDKVIGTDGAAVVVVADEANVNEEVTGEGEPQAVVPNGSFTNATKTKDLLDTHDANVGSAFVSDDEMDVNTSFASDTTRGYHNLSA